MDEKNRDLQQQLYDATVQHVAKREQQYAETMAADLTADQWQSIADAHKKVNFKHYSMLQTILGMTTLAHDYETEDQLRLLLTQIEVKLMDYGIHLPRSKAEAEQITIEPTPEQIVAKINKALGVDMVELAESAIQPIDEDKLPAVLKVGKKKFKRLSAK